MFLRLGVAESDSQLEQALARFLPPVLIKTDSKMPAVQTKVRGHSAVVSRASREIRLARETNSAVT